MLGKQGNCQVAVSVTLACPCSLPVAWQLYLPEGWASDRLRREKACVPQDVEFATKSEIALAQIERLIEQDAPKHCDLADAGYGVDTAFRERLSELGLTYAVGVTGQVTVWPPGRAPLPPAAYSGRGVVPTRLRIGKAQQHRPQSIKELAFELAPSQWQTIEWREGSNFMLRSRFARVRVHAAHRDEQRTLLRAEEWVLIEWPEGAYTMRCSGTSWPGFLRHCFDAHAACGAPAATVDNAPLRGCVAHRRRLRPHAHSLRLLKT